MANNDLTSKQIKEQLDAFDCEGYEVQCIPDKDDYVLKMQKIREFTKDDIIKSSTYLKAMNFKGYNIFIRPAPLEDDLAYPYAFVDDLTYNDLVKMRNDGLGLAIVIESSPKRYHGWIKVDDKPIKRSELTAICKELADRYNGDKMAADWRHYGRLAGYTNRKPKYKNERGYQPFVKLAAATKKIAPNAKLLRDDIARQAIKELPKKPVKSNISVFRKMKFPVNSKTNNNDDAYTFFSKEMSRRSQNDVSADDFFVTMKMVEHGYPLEKIKAALIAESPQLADRHKDYEEYSNRTCDFAFSIVKVKEGFTADEIVEELALAYNNFDMSKKDYFYKVEDKARKNVERRLAKENSQNRNQQPTANSSLQM